MFARVPSPEIAERFRPLPEGEVTGWGEGVHRITAELDGKVMHPMQTMLT